MSAVDQPVGRSTGSNRRAKELGFRLALLACLALAIGLLLVLLVDVVLDGAGTLDWGFINSFTSITADKAGIQAALWGTIWLMGVCALFIVPVGVATAIYLEEYADADRWWNRLDRAEHPEPRRGAVDRLRHPRACVPGARARSTSATSSSPAGSRWACWCCRW